MTAIHLPIHAEMKMADLIHMNYLLIPIIGRFGIELGFQNKTVEEVCKENNIDLSFFLYIINSYHSNDYNEIHKLPDYSINQFISYLKATHNYYLNIEIPELESIVNIFMNNSSKENRVNNKLIADFFESYKQELVNHFKQEENNLFPYTQELERALSHGQIENSLIEKIHSHYSAQNDEDHDHLEEKLFDLKNLIIKFLPPVKRKDILEKLLYELFRLEKDLKDHSKIEDRILLPKIAQLEKKVLQLGE